MTAERSTVPDVRTLPRLLRTILDFEPIAADVRAILAQGRTPFVMVPRDSAGDVNGVPGVAPLARKLEQIIRNAPYTRESARMQRWLRRDPGTRVLVEFGHGSGSYILLVHGPSGLFVEPRGADA